MIIRNADIWSVNCDWLCIPTNNRIYRCRQTGLLKAVMGAGLAKQARDRVPGIDQMLAIHLQSSEANVPGMIGFYEGKIIWSFPTNYDWRKPSDIELIQRSAQILAHYWKKTQSMKDTVVALPEVGCGEGGLEWSEVEPVLKKELNNYNFIVCRYQNKWRNAA